MLRIAIVDDHPIARHGLGRILEPVPDMVVVASVAGAGELPPPGDGGPDLVIMDLYLTDDRPALDEITAVAEHRPVLVISASREPADVLAAMQAGASGYLTKQAGEEAYLAAIRSVVAGGFYLSSQLADLIQAALRGEAGARKQPELSPRERQALSWIARGFTHQQAATRMGVSTATVNTYVTRIRGKLGLGNKAELALAALRYLRPGDPAED